MRSWMSSVALCAGLLTACGGDSDAEVDDEVVVSGTNAVEATIDRRGGTLALEGEALLRIPRGALDEAADMRIATGDLDTLPRVGGDFEAISEPLIITPHGLRLNAAATIEQVVTDDGASASQMRMLRLDDEDDRSWAEMRDLQLTVVEPRSGSGELEGADLSGQRRARFETDHFSVFLVVRVVSNGLCAGKERGEVCREAQSACDVDEVCDGESDDCPTDAFVDEGTTCRESAGGCDLPEACTGESAECPGDDLRREGSVCRTARRACELDSVCDGETVDCPALEIAAEGTVCREASGICDVEEVCDGEARTCPSDALMAAGTECEPAAACNAAALCTGESASCPIPVPAAEGTACDDGLFCTEGDACNGLGTCVSGTSSPCEETVADGDANCSEACVEGTDGFTCDGAEPDGTACVVTACAVSMCNQGSCEEQEPCPVFVNGSSGTDTIGCGDSWANACRTLEQANSVAEETSNPRVFVARGTYVGVDSTTVLEMLDGVAYYGSFRGDENSVEERAAIDFDPAAPPNPSSRSLLDADGSPEPVVVGASSATLDGFEVLDTGEGDGIGMLNRGDLENSSFLTDLTVRNTRFFGLAGQDTSSLVGRGMFNELVDGLLVENSAFHYNQGGTSPYGGVAQGAGMQAWDSVNVEVRDTSFVGNQLQGEGNGAGLATDSTSLTVRNAVFEDNRVYSSGSGGANIRGAAMSSVAGSNTLTDVEFLGNSLNLGYNSDARGGALHEQDVTSSLTNVRFAGNGIFNSSSFAYLAVAFGGAYSVQATGAVDTTLSGVQFIGNGLGGYGSGGYPVPGAGRSFGGAMSVLQGGRAEVTVSISDTHFVNNQTMGNSSAKGGGLYVDGDLVNVDVRDSLLAGNRSGFTGYFTSAVVGGGMFADVSSTTMTGVSFVANQVSGPSTTGSGPGAIEGGGAVLAGTRSNEPATAVLSQTRFTENEVYGAEGVQGAGLSSSDVAVDIRDSDFSYNRVDGLYGSAYGGGLHHMGSEPLTVVNVGFLGNQAGHTESGGGGGIAINTTAAFSIDSSSLVENSDGLYIAAGRGDVFNTLFANQDGLDLTGNAPANRSHLCTTSTTQTNDVALANPSAALLNTPGGQIVQTSSSPCLDAGDDGLADSAFGSVDWASLTARLDGTLDTGVVDIGRHYVPGQPLIEDFHERSPGVLEWTVRAPTGTTCQVIEAGNPGQVYDEPYDVPQDEIASGTYSGYVSFGRMMLTCVNGSASSHAIANVGFFVEG